MSLSLTVLMYYTIYVIVCQVFFTNVHLLVINTESFFPEHHLFNEAFAEYGAVG